ncbi:MAG: helix-turn-helix domain-containing protein [Methanolobus sp.]
MLLTSLQNLGFTSYEARVYAALVKNENATVSTFTQILEFLMPLFTVH